MGYKSRKIVYAIDGWGDRVFTPKYNPFYWLGTICFFLMALIFLTGIFLFLLYRTSNPYGSLQNLSVLGGIIRSIHRYASDGLILFLALHMTREFLLGRYRQWRRFSWISGNALLMASIFIGIMGYFLIWDERAQLIALKIAQLLDDIPIFIEPPPRTFLSITTMSKMLFFVILLGHIALSFILITILVIMHVSRNARAAIKPPKAIAFGVLFLLLILSIVTPATNAQPADLSKLPVNVPFDWFYFFIFPLSSFFPRWAFWALSIGGVLLLLATPWLNRSKKLPVIEINSERCVGCEQCNKDCPYEAIRMISRQDGRHYLLQSKLSPNRCASCGICVASCDSKAINLPDRTLEQMVNEIEVILNHTQKHNGPKILGLICEKSINMEELIDTEKKTLKGMPNVPVITFTCAGMIHHSMIEHALKSGADGIFVCGCQMEECYYREGAKWTRARMNGERAPVVLTLDGPTSNYSKIRAYWLTLRRTKDLIKDVNIFNEELKEKLNIKSYNLIEPELKNESKYKRVLALSAAPLILLTAFLIFFLSTKPTFPFYSKDKALIKFTFKRSGKFATAGRELTEKDVETKLKHMRKTQSQFKQIRTEHGRERLPTHVEIYLDDKKILSKTYYPTGLKSDGSTFAYEEIPVLPVPHHISIKMRDSKGEGPFEYSFEKKIDLTPGGILVIDFDRIENKFFVLGQTESDIKGE